MTTAKKIACARMFMTATLCICTTVPIAAAAEAVDPGHVPMNSMNRAEYEQYREQLDRKMRHVTSDAAQPDTASTTTTSGQAGEEISDPAASKSGYGKGYRARMEMRGGAGKAGGFRGGSVSRGAGGRSR
jgi:uncharacterized membrane protein YgcG